ncbi:MAG: biotin/lipoyl-binding protein, partial [Methylococcales bacterium]
MLDLQHRLSALSAARTPRRISSIAKAVVWLFLLTPVAMLLTPWQQNINGIGRVSAFAPIERQQTIEAPVTGRIVKWLAKEGSKVKIGDVLIEIADVDPEMMSRLTLQKEAAVAKLAAKEEELRAYQLQINN